MYNCFEYAASSPTRRTDSLGRSPTEYCYDRVRETTPTVRPWIDEMEDRGCRLPYVLCTDCVNHPEVCDAGTGGAFDPRNNTLYICVGRDCSAASYRDVFIHEYRHAYDNCMGLDFMNNCRHRACTEIQAYASTDGCDPGGAFRQSGESTEDCVRRKALESMAGTGCTDADLNAVFELCYFFLEPLPQVTPPESDRAFLLRKCQDSCINGFRTGELDPVGVEECMRQCESEYGPQ